MMSDGDFVPDPLKLKLTACRVRIKKLSNAAFVAKSRSLQSNLQDQLREAQADERDLMARIARLERKTRTQP
jgi:hypothetical protein